MRVAVLADIHGNLPALEAALAEVDREQVDRVVLLGDIATGPMPGPTLDLLAALAERAVWVHGNGERELVAAFDGGTAEGYAGQVAAACVRSMGRRHRDLLDGLPMTVVLDVDGLGPTLFCHATPRNDEEMVLVDSPMDRWDAVLAGVTQRVVACGHSHMPFDRLANGHRVVNPGSVGMGYGTAGASWALLGPRVDLRSTRYDLRAAASVIAASGYPDAEQWAADYVVEPPGDAEALRVFTDIADGMSPDEANRR